MRYYLSKIKADDDTWEIHTVNCGQLPRENDQRIYLGDFSHCIHALPVAKLYFRTLRFCPECSLHA